MTYGEVHDSINRLVADLTARAQAKLPPERELAARLQTSRTTIRKALASLEQDGVLRRVQGRAGGAYLTAVDPSPHGPEAVPTAGGQRKVARNLNEVRGVPQMLLEQGYTAGTRVIATALELPPPSVEEFLQLGSDALAVSILRVRFADGDSLSLERMYVSARRFPNLLEYSLGGSMYQLFEEQYGVVVGEVEEDIEATVAPPRTAQTLGIAEGDPLLRLIRRAHDGMGEPFEYSIDLFRADRTRLTVRTASPDGRVRSMTTDRA